jgi:hypothetical protein
LTSRSVSWRSTILSSRILSRCGSTAFLDRLHRGLHGALGGQDDDGEVVAFVLEGTKQIDPPHARHDEIAHDDRGTERGDALERFFAVRGGLGGEAPGAHELGETEPGCGFVLDNQDAFPGGRSHRCLTAAGPGEAWRLMSPILACRFYTVQHSSKLSYTICD